MELLQKELEINSKDSVYIYAFGDLHIASRAFEERRFKELIEEIKENEKAYWIGMGDVGECIIMGKDRRFDQRALRDRYKNKLHILPQLEAEELKKYLAPIAPKCLCFLVGNHEDSLRRQFSYDLTWELCNSLNLPYGSHEAYIRLMFRTRGMAKLKLDIFCAHGYGNARKWGGRMNKIADLTAGFEADIYLMAHQHSSSGFRQVRLALPHRGKLRLVEKEKLGVLVPSFYKTYQEGIDTYASKRLFPPSAIGFTKIKIWLERRPETDSLRFTTTI